MPNLVTESSRVQADCPEQTSTQSVQLATSQAPADPARLNKLPYQANHKAELIHLQEDIDALLQQLQTLKQQRQASGEQMLETVITEMPVLV
jgi:hypothetical protein